MDIENDNDTRDDGVNDGIDQGQDNNNNNNNNNQNSRDPLDVQLDAWMNNDGTNDKRGKGADDKGQQDGNNKQGQQGDQQQQGKGAQGQQGQQGNANGDRPGQVPAQARKFGSLFYADAKGDIYDARGSLIAKQGYGRSIFHKLYPTLEAHERELSSLRTRVKNYEDANTVAKQNGLQLDEYGAAMQLYVSWKKDPVKTLNSLLTIASENGKDVSSIRQGGVDMAAIRSMVDEIVGTHVGKFNPILEQQQRAREELELQDRVNTEYTQFLQEYPNAALHEKAIAGIMRDHNMDARAAYFAFEAWAAKNGYDTTKDLAPQIAARTGNGKGRPNGDGNNRQLPNMNGGRRTDASVEAGLRDTGSADESWDSIARRTLKQHGLTQ